MRIRSFVPLALAAALSGACPAHASSSPDAFATAAVPDEVLVRLAATTAPVRDDGNRALQRRRLAGEKAPASVDVVLVMCDFADSLLLGRHGQVPGDFPPPRQTDPYYAAHDSLYFEHLLRDVADYYAAVSGGAFEFRFAVHPQAVNLPHPMAWYGDHPEEGEQSIRLAADAVAALGADVDWPAYDAVMLVHAGAGEETDILGDSPEQIFSTYLDPTDFAAAVEDGVLDQPYVPAPGYGPGAGVDRVLVLPETARQDPVGSFNGGFGVLGTYCFEVGLHLGMLSLSDFTPSGRPDSQGIGQYGLMGYGLFVGLGFIPPQPCAFNRLLMGWVDPVEIDPSAGDVWALGPGQCARVSLTGQEYWLLEYRLQDPNGNRRFNFSGDLNGNDIPDFLDADSGNGDGTPTGLFDPATDQRERLTDAEWDFAMSENSARQPGQLGAGSGVYVWHVDEGVIADVFHSPTNLFNADPRRKSVDLEEADGIQDLDSNTPSDYLLGSDDDSFRGEGATVFGPRTRPDTRTAGGAPTGIRFSGFNDVVADSNAYTVVVGDFSYRGFAYADSMRFRVERLTAADGPVPYVQRELPAGTDPDGSHLLVGSVDGLGAADEIVLAGARGEVFVLDGDLNEFLDHDADPRTLEPFAVGTAQGEPALWHQPPALGDVDGDGRNDIVLSSPQGLYAFAADAAPLRDAGPGDVGLYAAVTGCRLPPVLLPADEGEMPAAGRGAVLALAVEQEGDGAARLVFHAGPAGARTRTVELGTGTATAAPVVWQDVIAVTIADTLGGGHRLALVRRGALGVPEVPEVVALPLLGEPGSRPPVIARAPGADDVFAAYVVDRDGRGETVRFDAARGAVGPALRWSADAVVASPLAPGGAFLAEDRMLRVGQGGDALDGWPVRPRTPMAAGAAAPLVARLPGVDSRREQYLFTSRDGRIFARDAGGAEVAGWPAAGPARAVATPALGALGGALDLDLVALGAFPRIVGNAAGGDSLRTETVATLAVWRDVAAAGAVWPMWGGSPWRNGAYDDEGFVTTPAVGAGAGIVAGSLMCYPSPLTEGPLRVRAQVRAEARVRAEIYNLSGEHVAATEWRSVPAVEPFTLEIGLDGVASGMYLCRLLVENTGGGGDVAVTQLAIVR